MRKPASHLPRLSLPLTLLSLIALCLAPLDAHAQDSTASGDARHIEAARKAVIATHAIFAFDAILPDLADRTLELFVNARPAQAAILETLVAESALELAAERSQLNAQLFEIWAATFSIAELQEIASFYSSPTGQKLARAATGLTERSAAAGMAWGDQMSQRLADQVARSLDDLARADQADN